jgi:hypothetical protein
MHCVNINDAVRHSADMSLLDLDIRNFGGIQHRKKTTSALALARVPPIVAVAHSVHLGSPGDDEKYLRLDRYFCVRVHRGPANP